MFLNPADDILARSTVETWVIKAEKGDVDCCPKCDGKVYEAEKMVTASGTWYHKNCFRCIECTRLLDSLTNNDGADGGYYCKKCYRVKYGHQTRSSDVDHKLIDLSNIKAEDPLKNCPRCSGAVFDNESVLCNKTLIHKKCATCFSCEKKLNSSTIYQEKDEFYCDGCYRRLFSPVGYRGAGCCSWVDAGSSDALRHTYEAY
jgi:cysteine/glycine-rich protein